MGLFQLSIVPYAFIDSQFSHTSQLSCSDCEFIYFLIKLSLFIALGFMLYRPRFDNRFDVLIFHIPGKTPLGLLLGFSLMVLFR